MPIERLAPGVVDRQPVKEPLQTGLKAIDAMVPIGRGQRELIIGDRQTGKTAVALDTIINQKGQGRHLHLRRDRPEAVDDRAGRADARGERRDGVHDRRRRDGVRARRRCCTSPLLGVHDGRVLPRQRRARARASTTTSRSTRRPTARSRCCCGGRRAARRTRATSSTCTRGCSSARRSSTSENGGGSLTALPIIETQAGDVSAYIPTNVISITDGQIFLEADLFNSGRAPGHQRRHLGVARRRLGADQGDAAGRGHACGSTSRSTASSRPSRSSAATSTRRRRTSSTAASA